MYEETHLSHADAIKIITFIQSKLEEQGRGAAIAVADEHGELIAFLRTDGCKLPSILIAMNKAYTAAREQRESFAVGESSRRDGFPMTNFGDLRYTAWGGGIPILHHDRVIGAVGVSGLPEADDMELARLGASLISDR